MWTDVKSKEARDALVQEHLSACLKKRFAAEKLGEADFQFEAAKLFQPITGEAEKQAAAQSKEIQKLASALEHLPRQIAEEANYNPIAALFGGEAPRKPPTCSRALPPRRGSQGGGELAHGCKPRP
jgi:hypothetical protein